MDEADLICSGIEFQSLGAEKENALSPWQIVLGQREVCSKDFAEERSVRIGRLSFSKSDKRDGA